MAILHDLQRAVLLASIRSTAWENWLIKDVVAVVIVHISRQQRLALLSRPRSLRSSNIPTTAQSGSALASIATEKYSQTSWKSQLALVYHQIDLQTRSFPDREKFLVRDIAGLQIRPSVCFSARGNGTSARFSHYLARLAFASRE